MRTVGTSGALFVLGREDLHCGTHVNVRGAKYGHAVTCYFIPPSENPGLSSPGMNDTTSTERALALA